MTHSVHTAGEKYVTLEYAALHAHVTPGYLAHLCEAKQIFFKKIKGKILIAESSLNSFIAKRRHTLTPHFAPADTGGNATSIASYNVPSDLHRLHTDMLSSSKTLIADAGSQSEADVSRGIEYKRQLVVLVAALVIYSGIYVLANTNSRFAAAFQQVHTMTASAADSIGSLFGTGTQ